MNAESLCVHLVAYVLPGISFCTGQKREFTVCQFSLLYSVDRALSEPSEDRR